MMALFTFYRKTIIITLHPLEPTEIKEEGEIDVRSALMSLVQESRLAKKSNTWEYCSSQRVPIPALCSRQYVMFNDVLPVHFDDDILKLSE